MLKRKRFRQKGKARLSKTFQLFKKGDKVVMIGEPGASPLPPQFRGRVSTVIGQMGRSFIVRFLNGKVVRNLVLKPAHLKKLNS